MSFTIRIEKVREVAEEVRNAFLKARIEAFRDLRKIDEQNKNKVNAQMACFEKAKGERKKD